MKKIFTLTILCFTTISLAQYNRRDGNRIGLSAGVSQTTLFTDNFETAPETGFAGGLSVRGNYYNNFSMIFGMQFFSSNFSAKSTFDQKIKYNLDGVKVKLLLSYNLVEDHVSLDFGPVLQINGKLKVSDADKDKMLRGTTIQADQILDISRFSGNLYFGISAGNKIVRAVVFYEYGFTNILSSLNSQESIVNPPVNFKGNLGTINGQIVFNL